MTSTTDTLSADTLDDTIVVRDSEGGVWWPSDEAVEEITASSAPEQTAPRICRDEPMRGEWRA